MKSASLYIHTCHPHHTHPFISLKVVLYILTPSPPSAGSSTAFLFFVRICTIGATVRREVNKTHKNVAQKASATGSFGVYT